VASSRRLAVVVVALLGSASASADNAGDQIVAPPASYRGNNVTVAEHLGAQLPRDAAFRTAEGRFVTLGQVIGSSDLPIILTFNYADCPMLCNQQLNGLSNAMPIAAKAKPVPGADKDVAFVLGKHYRILTIDLEPHESLEKAARMRKRYLDQAKIPDEDRDAWTFLVAAVPGDASQIRRIAETVGFQYNYIPERAEWAHPAAFIFLSSAGAVTRYVYGIQFDPGVMEQSIFQAGKAEAATSSGFLFRCYHYDPSENSHARAGLLAMKIGAASCLLLLGGFGFVMYRRRRHHHDDDDEPEEVIR